VSAEDYARATLLRNAADRAAARASALNPDSTEAAVARLAASRVASSVDAALTAVAYLDRDKAEAHFTRAETHRDRALNAAKVLEDDPETHRALLARVARQTLETANLDPVGFRHALRDQADLLGARPGGTDARTYLRALNQSVFDVL
jgi:hypothetical protein